MNQTVKLELSVEELNIVLAGLGELPLKVSSNIAGKIHQTANEQLQTQQLPTGDK